ncbi:von Willebrand factor-like [Montipora foliosa]|uniref:von Willebrand factor-like n=1 Tax=Montipora foliosa TaxID=591990 RepID=UPI0035F21483
MRTTYCVLGLRAIPPLEETRHKMMTYLLDRHDNSRDKRFTPYYDVVFVLDSSESVSRADFNVSVSVAKSLVTRFEPDSRFAAITFGANASVSFNFKSPKLTTELLISKMHHQGGNKSILNALETTQNGLLLNRDSGVREGSQKRVVLVANGPATENLQSLTWAASRIKALGPEIFLVALGDRIPSVKELVAIPTSTDAHFYRISNMSAFKQIVDGIPVHIFYRDYYFDD